MKSSHLIILLSSIVVLASSIILSFYFFSQTTQTCTLHSTKDLGQSHIIYTSCGDLQLTPDVIRDIAPPETDNFLGIINRTEGDLIIETIGYRIPPIDVYPIILDVRPAPPQPLDNPPSP